MMAMYYGTMRSHHTPIDAPPLVRIGASALAGVATAVMTTSLPMSWSAPLALVAVIAAVAVTLTHPYRRELRGYYAAHGGFASTGRSKVQFFLPLFPLWVLLMVSPLMAPAHPVLTGVVFLAGFAGTWVVFPHIDGTRLAAYL
ncbi:hypothetical protein ACX3T8_03900 [Corynebacterium pyruviciproducens]